MEISCLPEEIMCMILEMMSLHDLKNVNLVCRQWHRLGRDPKLWRAALCMTVTYRNVDMLEEMLNSKWLVAVKKMKLNTKMMKISSWQYVLKEVEKSGRIEEVVIQKDFFEGEYTIYNIVCPPKINT